ncbi:hypothetical protein QNH28_11670 [Paenibacillus sp. G2S3]|uniref:hypothetical protein n=1 Tax=Paenibacillus sp. G2S3 TaxID=3047872 RepID=UPI0024C20751|nr:hypothetical protein [Paenibacillus sp. G2S3]WHY21592.1 hypothetical protein QNH28_11670 [Paenibacillus sp. G2S3]
MKKHKIGGITLRVVEHIMLWFVSTILFTLAFFGLELLEGHKISTTEYYGFQNIGFVFIFLAFLFSAVLYPIVIFPLSWVVRMIANPLISRILILLLSGIGGYIFFYKVYDERFIREYHLNSSIAIILFGIAGSIYVLVDYYLDKRS